MPRLSKINSLDGLIKAGHVDVSDPDGCWLWNKALFSNGYGRVRDERVHRKAWMLVYGPIPNRLLVLHRCDVKRCLNPKHLFLGTQLDNMHDMIAKGRKVVRKGETHPMKTPEMRAAMSGENHWTKRHPERIASGDRHWSKLHPELFAETFLKRAREETQRRASCAEGGDAP